MFSFLEQYAPDDVGSRYGFYGVRSGQNIFGGQEFRALSTPDKTYLEFRIPEFEQCTDGLKFHLPVPEHQIAKALPIIAETVGRHGIGEFKVRQEEWPEKTSVQGLPAQNAQEGKDFVIYVGKGKDSPAGVQVFLNDLEERLAQAGIGRPKSAQIGANLKKSDKKVKGSNYFYYRYDHPNGNGYIPANCGFIMPRQGDMMEQIYVQSAVSAQTERHSQPLWRTVPWRALPGDDNSNVYLFTCDMAGMSPAHRHKFVHELTSLNLKFERSQALHRDGRLSDIVIISPESQDDFARLHGLDDIENAHRVKLKDVNVKTRLYGQSRD